MRSFLKKNMNIKFLSLAVAAAFTLVGCGGGGGGEQKSSAANQAPVDSGIVIWTPPAAPAPSNSGSVDARFVAGAAPRFFLAGNSTQASGDATPFTQNADGTVTAMGKYTLTGTQIATQEISGNANFAQGRWNVGTVSSDKGVSDIMKADGYASYHYVLFNGLAAFPASGTLTCDAGKFTKPNYVDGGILPAVGNYFGTSTGSAAMTLDAKGAHVTFAVSTTAGGVSGSANISSVITGPNGTSFFSGGGAGNSAWLTLGDAGNGSIYLIAQYTVGLANSNTYRGLATFTCK